MTPQQQQQARQQAQQRAQQGRSNDVFAGRDGSAYRRGPDGGWQQHDGQGWNKANLGGAGGESADRLNQDQRARSMGDNRERNFGNQSRAGGGSGGGGRGVHRR